MSEEDVRRKVLEILLERGSMSFEELLSIISWKGDLRPFRRILADMVREGLIVKEPDYTRKKMVYRVKGAH